MVEESFSQEELKDFIELEAASQLKTVMHTLVKQKLLNDTSLNEMIKLSLGK
jgi:hypothetical protein